MATAIKPIPQETIDTLARRAYVMIDMNPRQLLWNDLGMDDFYGGGNVWPIESARSLDVMLSSIASYQFGQPNATLNGPTIFMDTGADEGQWTPCTVEDVRRLRDAFFALYGLGKPNYYGPPYSETSPQPVQ